MPRLSLVLRRARAAVWRLRRVRLLLAAKVEGLLQGSRVDLQVDKSVRLGRGVRVVLGRKARTKLTISTNSDIGNGVLFDLRDEAVIEIGPRVQVRDGCRLVANGPIRLLGDNRVSWDCRIFSTYGVVIAERSGLAQNVTIVDNRHFFSAVPELFWANVEGAPISIESDVWLAPGAVISAGVTVGEHCIVGANAVVTKPIAPHRLAVGIPASERPLRDLDRSDCLGRGP